MKKKTCDTEKREAESDEQKQIHNEEKRLATQKQREAESDEQKQIHNEKKDLQQRQNRRQSLMSRNKFTMNM